MSEKQGRKKVEFAMDSPWSREQRFPCAHAWYTTGRRDEEIL